MFHKFKKPTILVNANFVWPLRCIFILVALYFSLDVYEILQSGVANYRHGIDGIRGDTDLKYWLKFLERLLFSIFFILLALNTKSGGK